MSDNPKKVKRIIHLEKKYPNKLFRELRAIERDCNKLKKTKQLTEYGQGQLDIIKIIKEDGKEKAKNNN